jgi:hypothetical protein
MRLRSWLAIATVMGGLVRTAVAQDVTVIRAGRLVDVDKGEIRRDQLIVIRGGRATCVTAWNDISRGTTST